MIKSELEIKLIELDMTSKVLNNMKEKWWLILIVAIIAILLLIPTKTGLPDSGYRGCDNTDPELKSYCLTTNITNISQEGDGLTTVTLPIEFSEGKEDVVFILKKDRGLRVNDTVFINIAEWDKKAYLFINKDSNLLFSILGKLLGSSQGATAVVDLNTLKEI